MAAVRRFPWVLVVVILLVAVAAAGTWWFLLRPDPAAEFADRPVHTVSRGPLRISVLESGSIEALRSQTITSRVEGRAAILYIIPEGTVITPEDVQQERLLVQLDVAELEEKLNAQKIDLASAVASYENAVSTLDIQRQQNASELRKAGLEVRFARLDLERYVGKKLADELLDSCNPAETDSPLPVGAAVATDGGSGGSDDIPAPVIGTVAPEGLILECLQSDHLAGEALQTLRLLDTDISLAEEELRRAEVKRDWSTRLLDKGYVSREEEEADRIALERRRIELDRAKTARDQYVTYDFRKEVEQLLSNLIEAEAQSDRTAKSARSSEAREAANVRSRKEQQDLKADRFKKLQEQIEVAQIHATQPGLVVYASSRRQRRWRSDDAIQEGTIVQERQPIIEIPDLSSLGVKVSVHESVVEKVREGQSVHVVVDAFKDRAIPGTVVSVARLPDPPDSWLNPDLKVYSTEMSLDDVPPGLRPGMSAKVEILVADLPDVVAVPVQAIAGTADRPAVQVVQPDGTTASRTVVLGMSNDVMVEIKEGLKEGETILLAPHRTSRLGSGSRRPDLGAKKDEGVGGGVMAPRPSPTGGGGAGGGGRNRSGR